MGRKKWTITSDKFLTLSEVAALIDYVSKERDLGIARGNNSQAVKDYYIVRAILETGLRVAEFSNLVCSDFQGQKLNVREGKGGNPRTILLTKATGLLLKEWLIIKERLGFPNHPQFAMFPSRYKEDRCFKRYIR